MHHQIASQQQTVPVIMEPKALDFEVLEQLQQTAFAHIIAKTGTGYLFTAQWGKMQQARFTCVLNNTTSTTTGMLSAYAPVPMWLLPKRQILMGTTNKGTRAHQAWNMPWYIHIGDWDGF